MLQAVDRPVQLDADTVCSKTSWQAATLAAGITLEAVDRGGFALSGRRGTTRSRPGRWASAS